MRNFFVSFLFVAALWHIALTVHALATSPCRGIPQNQHPSHLDLVFNSLQKCAGINLASRFNLPTSAEITPSTAKFVYEHPTFVLLSHSTDLDPIFTYANTAAQKLFKMDYTLFTSTPSRYSAEEGGDREQRQIFMEKVKVHNDMLMITRELGSRLIRAGFSFVPSFGNYMMKTMYEEGLRHFSTVIRLSTSHDTSKNRITMRSGANNSNPFLILNHSKALNPALYPFPPPRRRRPPPSGLR